MKFDMKSIKTTHITLGGVATAVGLVALVYANAETLGFQIDRWAWKSEVVVMAGAIENLQKTGDQRELFRLEQRLDDLETKALVDRKAGRPINEVNALKIRQTKRQLNQLKSTMKDSQ